jgi:hypothetical protein
MGSGSGVALIQLAFSVPCYAIFGMLGSLLGLAIFRKKTPPVMTTPVQG